MRTWLFGIAHNVAREQQRKHRRSLDFEPIEDTHLAPGPSPLDQVTSGEALTFVDAFLRSLDDDKRAVFVMADLEQMRAPEIAEVLGVNLNTVYSRLRAAREAFQVRIQQRFPGMP
jgi:RNA polymerase sigma-70 factor (ECF subfamily)